MHGLQSKVQRLSMPAWMLVCTIDLLDCMQFHAVDSKQVDAMSVLATHRTNSARHLPMQSAQQQTETEMHHKQTDAFGYIYICIHDSHTMFTLSRPNKHTAVRHYIARGYY